MTSQFEINAYILFSLLCAIINIAPTISHLRQGHSGPGAFGVWVVLLNACDFANGVVWKRDAVDRAPIFCDLSSKITLVGPLGLLIANCCIIRYLAVIVQLNNTLEDLQNRRRRQLLDFGLAFGFPAFVAVSSLLYQVARYQVNRIAGCSPVTALVWPNIFLSLIWPPIMCGIACGYSIYVMYWLVRRNQYLVPLIQPESSMNFSRFIRMGALSATYLCISAPCTALGTVATIRSIGPYVPWARWSEIHNAENNLTQVRQDPLYELELRDWLAVFAGLTIFIFFSFAKESVAVYSKMLRLVGFHKLVSSLFFAPRKQPPVVSPFSRSSKANARRASPVLATVSELSLVPSPRAQNTTTGKGPTTSSNQLSSGYEAQRNIWKESQSLK